jgi:nucleoid-associated protein YgaU
MDKAPSKGQLRVVQGATDGPTSLEFHYNPAEITITKSSDWKAQPTKGAKKGPKAEFTGTNPRELKMQLHLEGWANGKGDVSKDVATLFSWTNPTQPSQDKNKAQPPVLLLQWGSAQYFECYLKSVSAKYTFFDPDGTPLRAVVDVSLGETPVSASNQNPTSGGVAGRRQHRLVAGESLQSVAYEEYGTPTLWRALAEANGIDDPLRVRPGRVLLIPPQIDAESQA